MLMLLLLSPPTAIAVVISVVCVKVHAITAVVGPAAVTVVFTAKGVEKGANLRI